MTAIDIDSPAETEGKVVRRTRPRRSTGTINVRLAPLATPEAAKAVIGRLIEEWAALTYACMVESALAAEPANDPMHSKNESASVVPAGVGEA